MAHVKLSAMCALVIREHPSSHITKYVLLLHDLFYPLVILLLSVMQAPDGPSLHQRCTGEAPSGMATPLRSC